MTETPRTPETQEIQQKPELSIAEAKRLRDEARRLEASIAARVVRGRLTRADMDEARAHAASCQRAYEATCAAWHAHVAGRRGQSVGASGVDLDAFFGDACGAGDSEKGG